ncbi:MFS general substrate transporter [Cristinia sonorae]|uniref:MFS general substrate transporter n=1 Tax=Cristinia sonorae TaxID=1940300 RepID=A0A8K0UYS3_9AGAR|nr:MFS general substrate transporter [Cristinia sonorae]
MSTPDAQVPSSSALEPPAAVPTTHSQDSMTVYSNEGKDINTAFEHQAYGPEPGEKSEDDFEVRFEEGAKEHPHNWSRWQRWYITALTGILVLNATFASSAPAGYIPELREHFHMSEELGTLTIALFVAGYCVGPLIWAPLSEQYGRRAVFIATFIPYVAFQVGAALSPNTAALLIFRFIGGTFASAPLTNSGAVMADIWDPRTRGKALALFTLAPFAGPAIAPVIGGYMATSGVYWRWIFWVLTLFAGGCLLLIIFTLPETFVPILLVRKAERTRKETGEQRWWAPLERRDVPLKQRIEQVVARPFQVLIQEPMVIAITIYMSFLYGCVYLLFEAYPIVFSIGHHMSAGVTGLMFIPIFVGAVMGVAGYILVWNPRYEKLIPKYAPYPVPPEARLEQSLWASPIFAISFFWFGWTSYPSISFWAPMLAGLAIGFSTVWIFLSLFNYIIDAYLFVAASALASSTVVRSLAGAGFPLFATQMYESLNPRWASTLLGFIAVLLAPIPFVLMRYGSTLRKKSKYAPMHPREREIEEEKKRQQESAKAEVSAAV